MSSDLLEQCEFMWAEILENRLSVVIIYCFILLAITFRAAGFRISRHCLLKKNIDVDSTENK